MIEQTQRGMSRPVVLCFALIATCPLGCVRRTLTIQTQPPGALVFLNDEEIGRSPVATDFTWYGDYEVIIRHEGYTTLDTHFVVPKPWYQWPMIDLFSEALWVGKIHDEHFFEFQLQPSVLPVRADLTQRAFDLRRQALGSDVAMTAESNTSPGETAAKPEADTIDMTMSSPSRSSDRADDQGDNQGQDDNQGADE